MLVTTSKDNLEDCIYLTCCKLRECNNKKYDFENIDVSIDRSEQNRIQSAWVIAAKCQAIH